MCRAGDVASLIILSTLTDTKSTAEEVFWSNQQILTHHLDLPNGVAIEKISPISLAYLGDAIYELYIRNRLLMPPKKISFYHHQVVKQVKAEAQAAHLESILSCLTPQEQEILRRGRNAANHKPKRVSAKIYQQATSFETLIGYLYLSNCDRLQELLKKLNISADLDA